MSESGEAYKTFHVHDGLAIKTILPEHGIIPVIMTGRSSGIVEFRAKELGIKYIYQDVSDKAEKLKEIARLFECEDEEVAYIGDDIADLEAMKRCGKRGCPANAVKGIKKISDYVTEVNGGEGAVREFVEWLMEQGAI